MRWLQRSLETIFQFSTRGGRTEHGHLQPGEGVAIHSFTLPSKAGPPPH